MERRARQIQLSLLRAEWETILNELDTQPETAECCAVAIDALRSHLSSVVAEPDDVVSLTQTSVAWSTLILGICLHLTHVTTLLHSGQATAEPTGGADQAYREPGLLGKAPADAQAVAASTADDCWERIDRN